MTLPPCSVYLDASCTSLLAQILSVALHCPETWFASTAFPPPYCLLPLPDHTLLAQLAYGATGTPGGPIPPNAELTFDVKLLSVQK